MPFVPLWLMSLTFGPISWWSLPTHSHWFSLSYLISNWTMMNLVILLDFHLVSPQKLIKIHFKIVSYLLIPLGLFNLNSGYKIFWITGYLVIFSLIPMIVIIRNNIIILLELQSTSKMKREKTAMVLFATVTVFLVCHDNLESYHKISNRVLWYPKQVWYTTS